MVWQLRFGLVGLGKVRYGVVRSVTVWFGS